MIKQNFVFWGLLCLFLCSCDDNKNKVDESYKVVNVEGNNRYSASMSEGIDFKRPGWPDFIKDVKGISGLEPNGRWTDGETVEIDLNKSIEGNVNIVISASPYGENAGKDVVVSVGGKSSKVVFNDVSKFEVQNAKFNLSEPSYKIQLSIPKPSIPTGGDRKLGIFIESIKIQN